MTGNVFFDALIVFLLSYAVVSIIYEIIDLFVTRYSKNKPTFYVLLCLNHKDESLECDIRCALSLSDSLKCDVLIACDELDRDELFILRRLTDDRENVTIVSLGETFSSVFCNNGTADNNVTVIKNR